MGKKKSRSTTVSKGERRSCVAGVKLVRQARTELEKGLNKVDAWRAGKNPWVTVQGPGKRVRAKALWGDSKKIHLPPSKED